MNRDEAWKPVNILRLAEIHIKRYAGLIDLAERKDWRAKNVNVTECGQLLDLWNGIKEVEGDVSKLSMPQFQEIEEAIEDDEAFAPATSRSDSSS